MILFAASPVIDGFIAKHGRVSDRSRGGADDLTLLIGQISIADGVIESR